MRIIDCAGCPELSCTVDVEEYWGAPVKRVTCECRLDAEPGERGCVRREEEDGDDCDENG